MDQKEPRERYHSAPTHADSSSSSQSTVQERLRREGRDARNVLSFFIPNEPLKRNSLKRRSSSRSQSPLHHRRSQSASAGSRGSHSSPRSSLTRSTPFRLGSSNTSPRKGGGGASERLSSTAPFTVPETSTMDARSAATVDAVARGIRFAMDSCNNSLDELYTICADLYKRPIVDATGTAIKHPMATGKQLCASILEMLESAKQDFLRLKRAESEANKVDKEKADGKHDVESRDGSTDSSASGNRERSQSDSKINKSNIHVAPKNPTNLVARSLFIDMSSSSDEEEMAVIKEITERKNKAILTNEVAEVDVNDNVLKKYNYSKPARSSTLLQRLSSPDRKKGLGKKEAARHLADKQSKAQDLRQQNQQQKREKLKAKHQHVSHVAQQFRHERERDSRARSLEDKLGKAEGNAQEQLNQKRKKAEQQNQRVDEVSFMKSLETEMKLADFNDKLEGAATLRNQALAKRVGRASVVNERAEAALEKRKEMERKVRKSVESKSSKLVGSGSRSSLVDGSVEKFYCIACGVLLLSRDDAAKHGKSGKHLQRVEVHRKDLIVLKSQDTFPSPEDAHALGAFVVSHKEWDERQKRINSAQREGLPSKWSVRNKKKKSQRLRKLILDLCLPDSIKEASSAEQWASLIEAETNSRIQEGALQACKALAALSASRSSSSSSVKASSTSSDGSHALEKHCEALTRLLRSETGSLSESASTCLASLGYALCTALRNTDVLPHDGVRRRQIVFDCLMECFSLPAVRGKKAFVCAIVELAQLTTHEFQALGSLDAEKRLNASATLKQNTEYRKGVVRHSRTLSQMLRMLRCFFIDAAVDVAQEPPEDAKEEEEVDSFGKFQAMTFMVVSGLVHRLSNVLTRAGSKESSHEHAQHESPVRPDSKKASLPSPGHVSPLAEAEYTLYFESAYLIEALSSFAVHLLTGSRPGDRARYERFADVVENTSLAGILPLVTSLTLTPFSHKSKSTTNMIGVVSVRILLHAFRAMNMVALGGLRHFQRIVGNFRTQLYHSLCALMTYAVMKCHDQASGNSDARDLLVEMVVFCGYLALKNPENQNMFRWGHSPTLLETLCNLPVMFFTKEIDGGCRDVLMPTLLAMTCGSDANRTILCKDVSESLIKNYLEHIEENYRNFGPILQSRLPSALVTEAMTFFHSIS